MPGDIPAGQAAATLANLHAYVVGASMYGGPSDPTTPGDSGKYGKLDGTMGFAVLGMGTDMGDLAPLSDLVINYNGKSVTGKYLDIGEGGASVQGHVRAIDLWYQTAAALDFPNGVGLVKVYRPDGKAIKGIRGTATSITAAENEGSELNTQVGDTASAVADAPANAVNSLSGAISSFFGDIPHLLMLVGGAAIGILALVEIGKAAK